MLGICTITQSLLRTQVLNFWYVCLRWKCHAVNISEQTPENVPKFPKINYIYRSQRPTIFIERSVWMKRIISFCTRKFLSREFVSCIVFLLMVSTRVLCSAVSQWNSLRNAFDFFLESDDKILFEIVVIDEYSSRNTCLIHWRKKKSRKSYMWGVFKMIYLHSQAACDWLMQPWDRKIF